MTQQERRMYLIKSLLAEDRRYEDVAVPAAEVEQRRLLRGLMNVRPPRAAGREFLRVQADYLRQELAEEGVTGTSGRGTSPACGAGPSSTPPTAA